jgi:hypothetical protein
MINGWSIACVIVETGKSFSIGVVIARACLRMWWKNWLSPTRRCCSPGSPAG